MYNFIKILIVHKTGKFKCLMGEQRNKCSTSIQCNTTQELKSTNYWHVKQLGWTSEILYWM